MKIALLFTLAVAACSHGKGSPTDVKIDDLGITVTLEPGWTLDHDKGQKDADFFGPGNLRHVTIEPTETVPASLEELVKATEQVGKILDKQTFATGFGVAFNDGKRDEFLYYATVNGKAFACKPGPYYKPTQLAASKKLCSTIR
jgi:hypothetical protein